MKNVLYIILYVSFACLFAACGEIRYIGIDTYNPSEITYPEDVRKILIANNAMPQPPETGCEYTFMGVAQATCDAKADSALYEACRSLGKALVESNYFDDVLLFDTGLRQDSADFFRDGKLQAEDVEALCEETGADAVLSFDRLIFQTKKDIEAHPEGYLDGNICIYVTGILRGYFPGRSEPAISVLISDSVFISDWGYSIERLNSLLPSPEEALQLAAGYIGEKVHTIFVPHWVSENRWFYTGVGSRWKEATAYAASEKWNEASERWQYLYDRTSGWKLRAKLASNLALSYELGGEFEKALEQANTSCQLFLKHEGAESASTLIQSQYAKALEKRIQDDKKLNLQFRKEDKPVY